MRHRTRILSAATVGAVAAGTALVWTLAGTAGAATALPAHVFAPYFEAWNGDSLSGLASQSGNKYAS